VILLIGIIAVIASLLIVLW